MKCDTSYQSKARLEKIPLFLVLVACVIAPLGVSGMPEEGERPGNSFRDNNNAQGGSRALGGQDHVPESGNEALPGDTDTPKIPGSGAGGGVPARTGHMDGRVIQHVDPLSGIHQRLIIAWMNARTQEERENAFKDITAENSSSSASTLMPEDEQKRVLAALNAGRDHYNAANVLPARLQTLSNRVRAAWSRGLHSISRVNTTKDLEATIGPLEGLSPALLKDSIVAALQNNGKLEKAELDQLLTTIKTSRCSDPKMDIEELQKAIERRVMAVPVHLANHLLADADAALLASFKDPFFSLFFRVMQDNNDNYHNEASGLSRKAQCTNNIKSALLFRKSAREYERMASMIQFCRDRDAFFNLAEEAYQKPTLREFLRGYKPAIRETLNLNVKINVRFSVLSRYIFNSLIYNAKELDTAAVIREKVAYNPDSKSKSLLLDVAQAYESDVDMTEACIKISLELMNRIPDEYEFFLRPYEFITGPITPFFSILGGYFQRDLDGIATTRRTESPPLTEKLLEELSATQPNQENITRYEKAFSCVKEAFNSHQAGQKLTYDYITKNSNHFPIAGQKLDFLLSQIPGISKYRIAQELFEQAAHRYVAGYPDHGARLSAEAENLRFEAQQLDPTFEHVSLK